MNKFNFWNIINISKCSNKIYPNEIIDKFNNNFIKNNKYNNKYNRLKNISPELSKEIIILRKSLNMTPKEFSNKLNIHPSIYIDIENSSAIYNNNIHKIIIQIENEFNIKFINRK
jgi:predicted transcriptional regulator